MNKLLRVEKIETLIKAAGNTVGGRKKLHKLAYLCQEAGTDLGQSFIFHYYGVYSPSLSEDLEIAERWNVISETPNGSGYQIKLGSEAGKKANGNFHGGLKVVGKLALEEPAVLEVLSTIVYLHRHGYKGTKLRAKLLELKGHLKKYFGRSGKLAHKHYRISFE
jgi:uncharacterized protein YwgA